MGGDYVIQDLVFCKSLVPQKKAETFGMGGVIVWLGAATPATNVAMDMFKAFDEKGASLDMTARYTYRSYDK